MKSFRFAIVRKNALDNLLEDGFVYVTNPKVSILDADVILIDLWNNEITAEQNGRNVLSNVLELNENYLNVSIETLVTIP